LSLYCLTYCTYLPELWEIFEVVYTMSPLDASGYFTITMMNQYINDMEIDFITHKEFWDTMSYFLYRVNNKLHVTRSLQKRRGK
jgi:hypothetical protein